MNAFEPHLIALFLMLGVGVSMIAVGVQKNALEWRRQPRRPSCGRHIDGRTCDCSRG